MVKTRKRMLLVFVAILVLAMSLSLLVACDNKPTDEGKEYTVTFMMKENGVGDWKQYGDPIKTDKQGKLVLPTEPKVTGFSFRAWYTDEACTSGKEFDGTNVKADMTVYAFLSDKILTVSINTGDAEPTVLANKAAADLTALKTEHEGLAKADNLTFDGWYTDKNCTVKHDAQSNATTIYGRYVAKVTFNNGYENVGEVLTVEAGKKITAPAVADIKKDYMDAEDITFATADGKNAFNFDSAITANTTIKVLWKTPGLEYLKNERTGNYYVLEFVNDEAKTTAKDFPVLSIPAKLGVNTEDVADDKVVETAFFPNMWDFAVSKIIINEGVKMVNGIIDVPELTAVDFPSTLKIIDSCFIKTNKYFENLTANDSFNIPAGVEMLINSYHKSTLPQANYNCKINVPSSVKYMIDMPTNLVFAEDSNFFIDSNRIYERKADGIYLITDWNFDLDTMSMPEVPSQVNGEDIIGIQVKAFPYESSENVKEITLPATWSKVGYNANLNDYKYFVTIDAIQWKEINTILYQPEFADSVESSFMNKNAYSVVSTLGSDFGLETVYVQQGSLPKSLDYAITGGNGVSYTNAKYVDKVLFIGAVEAGQPVKVNITATDTTFDGAKPTKVVLDKNSNEQLTQAELLEAISFNADTHEIVSIKTIKGDFVEGVINSNQYITIEYKAKAGGYKYQANADGTLTITGFDKATATEVGGLYSVDIPDEFNGKKITAIKANAFKDNQDIAIIHIGKNVKTIGDYAFKNTANLKEVRIADGALLETIGLGAFENIGSTIGTDGSITVTEGITEVIMQVPLKNMKDIKPYAFKSKAIKKFTAVPSEVGRILIDPNGDGFPLAKYNVGDFFFNIGEVDGFEFTYKVGIVQYNGKEVIKMPVNVTGGKPSTETRDVEVVDVKYVATAAGHKSRSAFVVGYRGMFENKVLRFEMMEGSVYFDALKYGLYIANVSKIHKNAFTDITNKNITVEVYSLAEDYGYEKYISLEDVKTESQKNDSTIFENGWFEGQDNVKNTFMANATESKSTPEWA